MKKALLNRIIMVLAGIGCLIALYLTVLHFKPDLSGGCGVDGKGCASVLHSAYSKIGPIPTSLFGLGMYALFLFLTFKRGKLLQLQRDADARRALVSPAPTPEETAAAAELPPLSEPSGATSAPSLPDYSAEIGKLGAMIWGLAAMGVTISWWLQYVALYQIVSFCPYCFSSACTATLIFLVATIDHWFIGRKVDGEQKLLVAVGAAILVLMSVMLAPGVVMQYMRATNPATENVARPSEVWDADKIPIEAIKVAGRPILGNPNAPLLIVEFIDYQCNHCKLAKDEIAKLLQERGDVFRVMCRNYPLPMHKWGAHAAMAAEAAGLQDKFWQMNELLFSQQKFMETSDFQQEAFYDFAKTAGLDVEKFKRDMMSEPVRAKIREDMETALRAGLKQTPTFFVVTKDKVYPFNGLKEFLAGLEQPQHPMFQNIKPGGGA